MSNFEFRDVGDGHFELAGAMSFETAERILRASERLFRKHRSIRVDFEGVDDADSAGLALLLEWKSQARRDGTDIEYTGLPRSILAIARTTEVEDLL